MKPKLLMLSIAVVLSANAVLLAAVPTRVITEAVEAALRKGGREAVDPAVRRAAMETGEQIARRHGQAGLRLLADGGMEAGQVLTRYGDDAIRLSNELTPAARRALVTNADSLMPLGRRLGAEAVEHAAKSPHTAVRLLGTYGDEVGMRVLRQTPAEDLPRLLRYMDAADTPATRDALLQAYRKEGPSLFQRIPPSLVLATGLSTAMIAGTVRATNPLVEIGNKISEMEPETVWADVTEMLQKAHVHTLLVLGALALILIWRPRRKHRSRPAPAAAASLVTKITPEGENV